ncbi:hypothetical protein [Thalassotalea profundi]|uniref:Uncharacterized protein n=1 Tax=Thalassotalea profundi TaxID=2036687 RepID=A0ABQ3IXC8_9GAMM|nr:hypothetical protein [Thalassotalea profundi]GHE95721.1 hypothetical protein GCM10011501_26580 [Thalassotalea profundi]
MQRTSFLFTILLPLLLIGLLFSYPVSSKPKTTTLFAKTPEGFIKAKIKNETFEELACYIAIDGFKKKFRLSGNMESKWVAATDKRFAYTSFSTWCDYIEFYPQYKKYKLG